MFMGKNAAELRSVTCHMASLSVTCQPTQVNAPRFNPNQTGPELDLPTRRDGRLSWRRWLVIYRDGWPSADSQPSNSRPHHL